MSASDRNIPGARAEVSINAGRDDKVRATIGNIDDEPFHWPRDGEEWKRLLSKAIPYIAGAALIVAATSSYQKQKCEREKDDMSYGDLTARKARRGKDSTHEAWEDTKDTAERNWFGFKKSVKSTADEAGNKVVDAKKAASRKASEATDDVKYGAKSTAGWIGDKAHDAADATKHVARSTVDATKNAAYKAEHAVGAAGSSVIAGASAAEEKAGRVMKDAGKTLEEDGRSQKRYWRGEETKQDLKKKGICSIM